VFHSLPNYIDKPQLMQGGRVLAAFKKRFIKNQPAVSITRSLLREFRKEHGLIPGPKPSKTITVKVVNDSDAEALKALSEHLTAMRRLSGVRVRIGDGLKDKLSEKQWRVPDSLIGQPLAPSQ
jgi:hypothetical protein